MVRGGWWAVGGGLCEVGGWVGGRERGKEELSVTIKDRSMHGLRCGRQTLTSQKVTRERQDATERMKEVRTGRKRERDGIRRQG